MREREERERRTHSSPVSWFTMGMMSFTPALAASASTRSISSSLPVSHIQSFHSLLHPLMCPRPIFFDLICSSRCRPYQPRASQARTDRTKTESPTNPQSISPRHSRPERSFRRQRRKRIFDLKRSVDVAVEQFGGVEAGETELLAAEVEVAAASLDELVCTQWRFFRESQER